MGRSGRRRGGGRAGIVVAIGALLMAIFIGLADPSFNDPTTTPSGVPGIA